MTERSRDDASTTSDSESIASFFDGMSATRNALFRANPALDYEQQVRSGAVLARLRPIAGETILDIGCGNARDMIRILEAGARIVGIDLSEGMIDQARRELQAAGHRDVRLDVGDATQMPFPDASFDKVLCSEVIEHIPDADAAVREIRRVLKPGGMLVISTPNRTSWYGFDRYILWARVLRRRWNHPFDNWRTMSELTSMLTRQGLEVSTTATVCYLPGFLATYFLPRQLQSAVVACMGPAEGLARRIAPGNGYLLVVTAVAPS